VTDQKLEQIVGSLLRTGVAAAAAVVFAGGVWYVATGAAGIADYHRFRPETRGLHSMFTLPGPQVVILLGLLLLIITPIARVGFALVAFALERDWAYVAITLAVLGVLLYSIGVG